MTIEEQDRERGRIHRELGAARSKYAAIRAKLHGIGASLAVLGRELQEDPRCVGVSEQSISIQPQNRDTGTFSREVLDPGQIGELTQEARLTSLEIDRLEKLMAEFS